MCNITHDFQKLFTEKNATILLVFKSNFKYESEPLLSSSSPSNKTPKRASTRKSRRAKIFNKDKSGSIASKMKLDFNSANTDAKN